MTMKLDLKPEIGGLDCWASRKRAACHWRRISTKCSRVPPCPSGPQAERASPNCSRNLLSKASI